MKSRITHAFAAAGLCLTAHAATVNVDFDSNGSPTFAGTAVLGGGTWNGVGGDQNGVTVSGLFDSTGLATAVSLSISPSGYYDATDGGNTPAGDADSLLRDYRNRDGNNPFTVTLTGLSIGATYDLVLYGAGDQPDQGSIFSGALTGTTTAAQRDSYVQGVNYIRGLAVADSNGSLVITVSPNASQYSVMNGLQISEVPEPGSALMGMLGSAVFFLRRRR
jgi:hypothetical protein